MTIARLGHIIERIATGRADFTAVSFVEHIALLDELPPILLDALRRIEALEEARR